MLFVVRPETLGEIYRPQPFLFGATLGVSGAVVWIVALAAIQMIACE